MLHRRPLADSQLAPETSLNLARLSAIESFSRSVLVSTVPPVALDVLGNIPFMRSVKPRERIAMTAVFSIWREGSELLTPLILTLVLLWFSFNKFFYVLGVMHFMSAMATTFLPKRL